MRSLHLIGRGGIAPPGLRGRSRGRSQCFPQQPPPPNTGNRSDPCGKPWTTPPPWGPHRTKQAGRGPSPPPPHPLHPLLRGAAGSAVTPPPPKCNMMAAEPHEGQRKGTTGPQGGSPHSPPGTLLCLGTAARPFPHTAQRFFHLHFFHISPQISLCGVSPPPPPPASTAICLISLP